MFSFFLSRYEWTIGDALDLKNEKVEMAGEGKMRQKNSMNKVWRPWFMRQHDEGRGWRVVWALKSDPSSNLCSATPWLFDFWRVANSSSFSFLICQILTAVPTLLAVVNIKRDTFCLSVQHSVPALEQSWLVKHPHCTHIPKGPWASADISWEAVACHLTQWERAWLVCPSSSQSHAGKTSHFSLLSSHCHWARASLSSLLPQYGSTAQMDVMSPVGARLIGSTEGVWQSQWPIPLGIRWPWDKNHICPVILIPKNTSCLPMVKYGG